MTERPAICSACWPAPHDETRHPDTVRCGLCSRVITRGQALTYVHAETTPAGSSWFAHNARPATRTGDDPDLARADLGTARLAGTAVRRRSGSPAACVPRRRRG